MLALMVALTVLAHLIIPPFFLGWIFLASSNNRLQWLTRVLAVGGYIGLMWKGGAGWDWFGTYWPFVFGVLYFATVAYRFPQFLVAPWIPEKKIKSWAEIVFQLGLAILLSAGIPETLTARNFAPEKAIALSFPLRGGTFHVGHGGSNETMNQHHRVPAQRHALDIVKVNSFGIRALGFLPEDLTKYAAFGAEVVAPCSGEILGSESELADQTPPQMDPKHLAGNHLIIYCKDSSILLAHLKFGTVSLKPGDKVEEGSIVGQVGNTGNTSEPHLHVHAVAGRHGLEREIAGSAEGIPILFDGKYLVRNDRVLKP
ncbi:MAG: M23 family metallopeptidase [Bdellovibrionia bacterium]